MMIILCFSVISQCFALYVQNLSNQRKSVTCLNFGEDTKVWMAPSNPQGAELSWAGQVTLGCLQRQPLSQRWRCLWRKGRVKESWEGCMEKVVHAQLKVDTEMRVGQQEKSAPRLRESRSLACLEKLWVAIEVAKNMNHLWGPWHFFNSVWTGTHEVKWISSSCLPGPSARCNGLCRGDT